MKRSAALAALALALAGCGSASPPIAAQAPPAASSAPAAPSSAAPSSPAPSPSPASTARLTRHQAARTYTALVDPSNRALDLVNEDYTDRAPLAQFRQDSRAYVASLRTLATQLTAVRWPARVEPYARAMAATDVLADIRCAQEELAKHSYNAVEQVSLTSQDCTAADNATSNASTIRSMLNLPGLG